MSKKIMAAILAGLMLFTTIGCTSEKNGTTDETAVEKQNENTPQMLTNVFKGNNITLPEEYRVIEGRVSVLRQGQRRDYTLMCER